MTHRAAASQSTILWLVLHVVINFSPTAYLSSWEPNELIGARCAPYKNFFFRLFASFPFPPGFYSCVTRATVRTSTRRAPALRKTRAHSFTVEPVV